MNFNHLTTEQRMEIYADTVADLTGQRTDRATTEDNPIRDGTAQALIEIAIDLDAKADDEPETPPGDIHTRTIQLLDRFPLDVFNISVPIPVIEQLLSVSKAAMIIL